MTLTSNEQHFSKQASWFFWLFVAAHVLLWTLASSLPRLHLPIDSLEVTVWSQHLLWGYEKNPYFNAWVMAAVTKLFKGADWGIYLSSRLAVAICFWGLWRLGREFLTSAHTLIAIMILESVQYFTFGALELNDNVLELSLWSLSASYFYTALKKDRLPDWLITGVCLGLGLMTKYYTLLLAFSFFLFLVIEPSARYVFKRYAFYLAGLLTLLICLPHFIWLTQHEFITLKYLYHRLYSTPSLGDHFVEPLFFLCAQLANFSAAIILIVLIFGFKSHFSRRGHWHTFDRKFLLCISLVPLLLSCLVAVIKGNHLHTLWGQPLPIWWGLLMVAYLQPLLTPLRWYFFLGTIFTIMLISSAAYAISMYYAGAKASTNYPGKQIAEDIDILWQQHFPGKPLAYLLGDRWRAGSVSHYSIFHPDVYIELNPAFSPWIDENQIKNKGAVIFWDAENAVFPGIPLWFQSKFPQIIYGEVRTYHWLRDPTHKAFYLGIALVPPGE